jgi:hypothetical protein
MTKSCYKSCGCGAGEPHTSSPTPVPPTPEPTAYYGTYTGSHKIFVTKHHGRIPTMVRRTWVHSTCLWFRRLSLCFGDRCRPISLHTTRLAPGRRRQCRLLQLKHATN